MSVTQILIVWDFTVLHFGQLLLVLGLLHDPQSFPIPFRGGLCKVIGTAMASATAVREVQGLVKGCHEVLHTHFWQILAAGPS